MTAAAWLFGASGAALAAIGAFFVFLRPAFLAEDLRFLGQPGKEINQAVPHLQAWLRLVFVVLGGQAVAAGCLVVFIAATAISDGQTAAAAVLVVAGAFSIGLMVAVNFKIRSSFRWALLAVAGLEVAATLAFTWH